MESERITMDSSRVAREEVTVRLENGLHLVPCAKISEVARKFAGEVRIYKGAFVVDAKALFDLMTLRAEQGTLLTLEVEGAGAEQLMKELVELFENDFFVDRN